MKAARSTPISLALLAVSLLLSVAARAASPIVIVHVTVIDVRTGEHQRDMAVLVTDNRITAVMPARGFHPVTGEGDCWGNCPDDVLPIDKGTIRWRKEIAAGTLVAPRIVASSPFFDGPRPFWQGSVAIHSPEEGRLAVDKAIARHDDFVKVYHLLHRDAYFAVAEEAKRKNIVFAGHAPIFLHVTEVSDAGQKSIEHMLETFSTWVTPTLVASRGWAYGRETYKEDDARFRYVKPSELRSWSAPDDMFLSGRSPEDWKNWHAFFEQQVEEVRVLHENGVPLLAGTDVATQYVFAGFGLHDELALLVQAGLSPLEALQTATVNPTKYFDDEKNYGSVAAGKVADLVLLDADPTEDIHNTTKIRAVLANGRLFLRGDLDELLNAVKKDAQ